MYIYVFVHSFRFLNVMYVYRVRQTSYDNKNIASKMRTRHRIRLALVRGAFGCGTLRFPEPPVWRTTNLLLPSGRSGVPVVSSTRVRRTSSLDLALRVPLPPPRAEAVASVYLAFAAAAVPSNVIIRQRRNGQGLPRVRPQCRRVATFESKKMKRLVLAVDTVMLHVLYRNWGRGRPSCPVGRGWREFVGWALYRFIR